MGPAAHSFNRSTYRHRPMSAIGSLPAGPPDQISVLYATPDGFPQKFRWRGAVHEVARVEGPSRITPEWWREKGNARLCDYYRIEDGAGRR